MPGITTPSATAHATSPIPALLTELHHADYIIKTMLRAMTVQQQARVGAELEAAGVAGDGITRHHERAAVIAVATAPASVSQHLRDIEGHAVDVLGQADHAEILLGLLLERLDQVGDVLPVLATVNCLAICTSRAVVLMREAADNVVALVMEGGAA